MLKIEQFNQYYGQSHTLWDLDLDVPEGQCSVLMGRNGVGKTTLLQCIMGLLPVKSGAIRYDGQDLTRVAPEQRDHERTRRRNARHSDSLPHEELIDGVQRLLSAHGLFYVLLPDHATERFIQISRRSGLQCMVQIDLQHRAGSPVRVSALTLSRDIRSFRRDVLVIYREEREYTPQSAHYLRPFLPRFADE